MIEKIGDQFLLPPDVSRAAASTSSEPCQYNEFQELATGSEGKQSSSSQTQNDIKNTKTQEKVLPNPKGEERQKYLRAEI